ncbi:MAG: NUDIX domain-containing protein [Alphaproteobacteria bacterium]|nr:NUDIX domain-containing protein [Alphaproteobacteria bacterium]
MSGNAGGDGGGDKKGQPFLNITDNELYKIKYAKRIKRGFLNIDKYVVSYRKYDGDGWTKDAGVEVMERGDSVGVLLFNRDSKNVIAVEQFRLPTVDRHKFDRNDRSEPEWGCGRMDDWTQYPEGGWIIETIAGMAKVGDETPLECIVRETREETGYKVSAAEFEPVARFFSSPGGTSEVVHLYFAEVGDENFDTSMFKAVGKKGHRLSRVSHGLIPGKDIIVSSSPVKEATDENGNPDPVRSEPGEQIRTVEFTLDELATKLRDRQFADPKLVICAYYLQARLGLKIETADELTKPDNTQFEWTGSAAQHRKVPFKVCFKTGNIKNVEGVDVWLNPENTSLMMDRVLDKSISSNIRWLGAEKYHGGDVAVDIIGNDLRRKAALTTVREGGHVETDVGYLKEKGVKQLLHIAIAKPKGGELCNGVEVDSGKIPEAVFKALKAVHASNEGFASWFRFTRKSVLIPLIGTGEAGLTVHAVTPLILSGIEKFLVTYSSSTKIEQVHLLVRTDRDLEACKSELDKSSAFRKVDAK